MGRLKFSVELSAFWPPADRCVPDGYRAAQTMDEMLDALAGIDGVDGTEIYWPGDFDDPARMRDMLADRGLGVAAVGVDIFGAAKWQKGALSSGDKAIRREAIQRHKDAMDACVVLGVDKLTLWPGQDGFDYPFQTDYPTLWGRIVDAIREIAEHNSAIQIGVEYKIKEPRSHLFVSTVGKTLVLVDDVGMDNVGVCVDVGHALIAFESPGESISLLNGRGRLFHIHMNDNYREWDYDMLPGTVHLWETLEAFFWIRKVGYAGWINFDICPFREDPVAAGAETIRMARQLERLAGELDNAQLAELQAAGDSVGVSRLLREMTLR